MTMLCTVSACKKSKKYDVKKYADSSSSQEETGLSSEGTLSENEGGSASAPTDSSASQSTATGSKTSSTGGSKPNGSTDTSSDEGQEYKLPDYDLDTDYTNDFVQDGRYIKIKTFATAEEYNGYVNRLLKDGYKKYDENKIGKNLFVSLVNKKNFISVSFTAGNSKLKIISEPLGHLYPRKADNKYTSKGMQSLFTGMKNENKPIYSGMGFVIRLDDGSFIIIDGGGGDRNHKDSNRLLNILNEQKPKNSGKPVIAAWIFTHCHDDHIGVFNAFSADFHDKVVIEKFYYNFPPDLDILASAEFMFNDDYYSYNNFKDCIKNYYSKSAVIRPHSGERYYIRNAVIEMLFSYEDLFPASIADRGINDFNETSLIFKVNVGGQSLMITGDASAMGMNFASTNYGTYLKSDILQMAHHGQNGTVPFYSKVDPTYALIPISHVDKNRVNFNEANKWLVNSKNVRQFIAFWSDNVTIPLPYNPTNAEIKDRIPTEKTVYNAVNLQ